MPSSTGRIRRRPICRWPAPRSKLNPCLHHRRLHVVPRVPSPAGSSHRRSWTSRSCPLRRWLASWTSDPRQDPTPGQSFCSMACLCMTCATMRFRWCGAPCSRTAKSWSVSHGATARLHPAAGDSRSGSTCVPGSRLTSGGHGRRIEVDRRRLALSDFQRLQQRNRRRPRHTIAVGQGKKHGSHNQDAGKSSHRIPRI